MSSFAHPGANATLSHRGGTAQVRTSMVRKTLALTSTESQAREARGFYPHQRAQGDFSLVVDCTGWRQVNQLNEWLREYMRSVLDLGTAAMPSPVEVLIPSRNFHRFGIPTKGIRHGDHVGSLVFSPEITFTSISDPDDPFTSIVRSEDASRAVIPAIVDPAMNYFYPTSAVNTDANFSDSLYGGASNPPGTSYPTPVPLSPAAGGRTRVGF